ncbi:MAG: hypothetical protein V3T77_00490, partial [Planctomycetota bacterium]
MGNGTKIGLVLVLVVVVVVIANILDRDIENAPTGSDQVARVDPSSSDTPADLYGDSNRGDSDGGESAWESQRRRSYSQQENPWQEDPNRSFPGDFPPLELGFRTPVRSDGSLSGELRTAISRDGNS